MIPRLKTALILGSLVALLVAVGYWNVRPESFMSRSPATQSEAPEVDFYALGTRTTQFQADGQRDYVLTAEKVEHLAASDVSVMTSPDLLMYRGKSNPWHVSSARGEVSPGGTEVELIDDVRVERTDAKSRPLILTTSRLTVRPEQEYAQTQQAVRIVAANGVTTATGMKAYLNDGRMILLSNVRGQHEAP